MASAREGYSNTLIAVADDCLAIAEKPEPRGDKPTVASMHYELLAGRPYQYTQADVLFHTWLRQQGLATSADTTARRDEFFAKPRACLRSSPLGKKYGWGIHFDAEGRVALVSPDSARYRALLADPEVKHLKALRSSR